MPLTIETYRKGFGVDTLKLTGFTEDEMYELQHCDYREIKEIVIDIANKRNDGIGYQWARGYGIYNAWTTSEAVYIEVGQSCD